MGCGLMTEEAQPAGGDDLATKLVIIWNRVKSVDSSMLLAESGRGFRYCCERVFGGVICS